MGSLEVSPLRCNRPPVPLSEQYSRGQETIIDHTELRRSAPLPALDALPWTGSEKRVNKARRAKGSRAAGVKEEVMRDQTQGELSLSVGWPRRLGALVERDHCSVKPYSRDYQ